MYHLLGKTLRDTITGYSGVATGHCEYISGCNQTLIVPPVNDKGELRKGEWFDDQRLTEVHAEKVTLDNSQTPGCDAAPDRNY